MVILKYAIFLAIFITACFFIKDIVKIIRIIKDDKENGRGKKRRR